MQSHKKIRLLTKSVFIVLLPVLFITISCGSTQITPVTLTVTRSSNLRPLPALHIVIKDRKAVQQLYHAAYNLPDASNSGTRHCLNDDGIIYHLNFLQDDNTSDSMDIQVSGCLILTTSQGNLQESYQFLDLVMKTIHVDPLIPRYQ